LDLVAKSKNPHLADKKSRYQVWTVNGKEYVRATYGHTFDLAVGADLHAVATKKNPTKSNAANSNNIDEGDEAISKVPTLAALTVNLIVKHIADYGPVRFHLDPSPISLLTRFSLDQHLGSLPIGFVVTQIFNRYKSSCFETKTRCTNKMINFFLTPHVESLDFRGIIIEDSIYRGLGNSCKNIKSLSFHGCFTRYEFHEFKLFFALNPLLLL